MGVDKNAASEHKVAPLHLRKGRRGWAKIVPQSVRFPETVSRFVPNHHYQLLPHLMQKLVVVRVTVQGWEWSGSGV
jgi:hypothetical protein